jgi:hypothetical protein
MRPTRWTLATAYSGAQDALEAAGCAIIYQDEGISGIVIAREGLA